MKALLNDLRLRDRRDVLKDILENAVPTTLQDVVIVFVTVSGRNDGQLVQETYANKIYSRRRGRPDVERHSDHDGRRASARCSTCWRPDQLPQSGFVRQEDIPLKVFLENRFGQVYAKPETGVPHQSSGGSGR